MKTVMVWCRDRVRSKLVFEEVDITELWSGTAFNKQE